MATLHLLSHSPFGDDRFASCLRLLGERDGLLLSGDAVHALQPGTTTREALEGLPGSIALLALKEDLEARGCDHEPPRRLEAIDYPRFVEACLDYEKVNSWL